jgi:hypothetical protein
LDNDIDAVHLSVQRTTRHYGVATEADIRRSAVQDQAAIQDQHPRSAQPVSSRRNITRTQVILCYKRRDVHEEPL